MTLFSQSFKILFGLLSISAALIALSACSSGGSGTQYTTYTGLTTPAELNSDNAMIIGGGGSSLGKSVNVGTLSESNNESPASSPHSNITGIIFQVLSDNMPDKGNYVAQTMRSVNDSTTGSCGGTATSTVTINDVTYDFTVTMSFNDYCDSGATMSGLMNATGSSNYSGSVMVFTTTGTELLVIDNNSNTQLLYKNYSFIYDIAYSTESISMNGTFYHQDYGYVLATNLSPFLYNGNDMNPYSGSMKLTEDTINPDSVTITALNNTQCQIDIDLSNDGIIDDSTIENW